MLTIRLLGGFDAQLSGKSIRIARNHAKQLLAYLIMERGKGVSREQLGSMFWPNTGRADQLAQFRHVLMGLERVLGKPGYILKPDARTLAFNIAAPHVLDIMPFLACETIALNTKSAEALMNLSASYQTFLPEFDESWVMTQRSRLETIHDERILRALVERLLADRGWVQLADWGRRALACPSNQGYEPVYVAVMRAEYQLHNPKGISDTYAQLQDALAEMGLVPSRATRELYDRMLREEEPLLPDAAPPITLPISAAPALHLPDYLRNPPTPLIGRDNLLKRVIHELGDPHRQLITLLGIGGIGKTRLAAAAATAAVPHFADGVYFVEADAAHSVESFYALLAESLRFSPYGQASLKQQVLDFLREKSLLLLVDNFETLLEQTQSNEYLEGAALDEELCAKTPGLKVLVTTRQSLQLLRETVFDVDGLDVPTNAEQPDTASYGAVALFAEIAGRVNDAFALERELPAVIGICQLVGGTPLAIEIAAALVRGMSCEQIAARIGENLDTLVSRWRDISPRQRSLRAVLEYANSLLAPTEQAVFARAAVFVGGFTQAAASEVANASHSALRALKDCALVRQDSAARFFMHSFVRQFSTEKLQALHETEATQSRLLRYFLAYAQRHSETHITALTALASEWANLLEGLRLAHAHQSWPDALAYADALSEPWYTAARYGDIRQGLAWACAAAEALGDERAQSRLLSHWGRACVRQGDYAEADMHFERGLKLAWKLIDSPSIARVLYERAQLLIERAELKQAEEMLDQCIEIYEELGDQVNLGEAYRQKARSHHHIEDNVVAQELAERALSIVTSIGDESKLPSIYRLLADIAQELQDLGSAHLNCEKAILLSKRTGNERELALAHYSQAAIYRIGGHLDSAINAATQSVSVLQRIGDQKSIAHVTNLLGYIHFSKPDFKSAIRYLSNGISILRKMGDLIALIYPLLYLGDAFVELKLHTHAREVYNEGFDLSLHYKHPLESEFRRKLDTPEN